MLVWGVVVICGYKQPRLVATLLLRLSSALERRCLGFLWAGVGAVSGVFFFFGVAACQAARTEFYVFLFFLPRMEVYLVFCILALRSPLRLALWRHHYWNQIQVDFTYFLTMRGGSAT